VPGVHTMPGGHGPVQLGVVSRLVLPNKPPGPGERDRVG
jgi:hypothetical protein